MIQDSNFDPNGVGLKDANIYGLPTHEENAQLIIIPVPWEVTVSYRNGTALGPEAVFNESYQVDLYDPDAENAWQKGYYMLPINEAIKEKSAQLREQAQAIIAHLENGAPAADQNHINTLQAAVNEGSKSLNDWVFQTAKTYLDRGKKVALLGGDHSTPLGLIKAIATQEKEFGLLQIDAHADLRIAYEGFTYSHASIMYNVLNEVKAVKKLVQVGIRDYCDEEKEIITQNPNRIKTFFDADLKAQQYEGKNWSDIVNEIIAALPPKIYISFDIDGLDPKLCPNTGTPVPGGFELEQIFYLLRKIKQAGIEIIAFDLNEISLGIDNQENSIDPIVGARLLYKLCNLCVV